MCDSEAIDHMTGDLDQVFDRPVLPKGQEWVMTGDGVVMKVIFLGTLNLKLHGDTDVRVQLPRSDVVRGLAINYQCTQYRLR